MTGIKETSEAVAFACEAAIAVKMAMADGKFNLADFPLLLPLFQSGAAAVQEGAQIPSELKELESSEQAQLLELAQQKLSVVFPEAQLELAKAAIAFGFAGLSLYAAIQGLKKPA